MSKAWTKVALSLYHSRHFDQSGDIAMAVVETERHGQVLVVRMNRPERLNALNTEMRNRPCQDLDRISPFEGFEVAIFTGTGRGFCAGEDMKEIAAEGRCRRAAAGDRGSVHDRRAGKAGDRRGQRLCMGGGFMLVERTDLAARGARGVFEVSEAKRWLLGGYNHGHIANLPYPIAMEMALGFRFTAQRFYEVGFLNRLVPADRLIPEAIAMAEHLLTLPPPAASIPCT